MSHDWFLMIYAMVLTNKRAVSALDPGFCPVMICPSTTANGANASPFQMLPLAREVLFPIKMEL